MKNKVGNYYECLADNIVKAMFYACSIDFKIENIETCKNELQNFDFVIVSDPDSEQENNSITVYTEKVGKFVQCYVYQKSENHKKLGVYDIQKEKFIQESDCFETLFFQILY